MARLHLAQSHRDRDHRSAIDRARSNMSTGIQQQSMKPEVGHLCEKIVEARILSLGYTFACQIYHSTAASLYWRLGT